MNDTIIVLDFGSQYTHLIVQQVWKIGVYCEVFKWDIPAEEILPLQPKGFILSGSPANVNDKNAPFLLDYITKQGVPILGICYGMHLLISHFGGRIVSTSKREYGSTDIELVEPNNALFTNLKDRLNVWMSHGDSVEMVPLGFTILAISITL
jgi:GMP synthase (glutamine-hydrolysing)